MVARKLTPGEVALGRSVYGAAIDWQRVEVRRRRWWPFQGVNVVMAPMGHIHFHPGADFWSADFAQERLSLQGLLIHELCHVWQWQRGVFLPLQRHPFCRYAYDLVPGKPFARYGLEQQAEIVRHAFLLEQGMALPDKPPLAAYRAVLPF
ncbi:hypothetical protein J2792_000394 [Novosphingobium capsulatum]|uniref:Vgr related protein n=1 Tax=Novosphingobium capsulatum TaxID=13688 RepID=A0ABU1MH81_9SPHN|nr:vgr related protein [Novosphingobium capsulatum]MDR6509554.1 hypothetical protein [Novosphingobium capsulatum]